MPPPDLPAVLQGEIDVLMIDNFDSFTWNLYQQISLQGAQVTVIRNDAIVEEQLPLLKIKRLIISPGPGHPKTDSGISNAAIAYFEGKVPVLGVCMGLECLVDLHGGTIAYAGEIMHGKVSPIRHDNRGCFRGIPQGIKSIRYHSLSAAHTTLPADLAITSATEESGVIMGVRHRKYTVEAVQYHPESILSERGDDLIKNFLSLNGGLWEDNPHVHVLDNTLPPFPYEAVPPELAKPETKSKLPTILEKIYAQRLADVAQAQSTPGSTLADLETLIASNVAPPLISFLDRISGSTPESPSLFAEIKRASPSKGPISVSTSPATQALTYALAGAHTISVLTEPKWFLGSLHDMLHARLSVAHLSNRPAILRKDFILSRYQVLESRIWGADTLLLIVSMLPEPLLRDLYAFSVSLGMEPLVEVNNAKEMEIALSLPAKVIGVNNRNLHNFEVDMNTTSRLSDMVAGKGVILLALSGIFGPEDVQRYIADGVRGVLVGESLMRAEDPAAFIRHLFSQPKLEKVPEPDWRTQAPLVKICGIKSKEEAVAVAEAGADMLGLIFVKKSKRFVDLETAREISRAVKDFKFSSTRVGDEDNSGLTSNPNENTPWLTTNANRLSKSSHAERPLLIGVFQNASLETILSTVSLVQLDIVQLHGSEPVEWAHRIPVPVIKVFHVGKESKGLEGITRGGAHRFVLLDSLREDGMSGGTGKTFDWDLAKRVVEDGEVPKLKKQEEEKKVTSDKPGSTTPTPETANSAEGSDSSESVVQQTLYFPLPIILAGGLTAENVEEAIARVRPWAVDVSGGVETEDGTKKDLEKVKAFINAVKGVDDVEDPPPSEPVSVSGDEEEGTEDDID